MALYSSSSSNNWALSLKVVLISTGVLSMAMALKISVPVVTDFVSNEIPSLWSFVLSWLKPPYLYVLINCIIISIVASSKLQQKSDDSHPSPSPEMMVPPVTVVAEAAKISARTTDYALYSGGGGGGGIVLTEYGYDHANEAAKLLVEDSQLVAESDVYAPLRVAEANKALTPEVMVVEEKKEISDRLVMNGDDEVIAPSMAWNRLQRKDSLEYSFSNENEKPPVSARFSHRKAVKASPEGGKALRVSKPKRQDTLESTWKTITEGRSMPLTRHLKKSDTWESHVRRNGFTTSDSSMVTSTPPSKMKKSETFGDRTNMMTTGDNSSLSPSPGSGKLRKEPSLSQDELNRRVEAFIKKFNEEMRLQRQESLNQYQEMIRRGAH